MNVEATPEKNEGESEPMTRRDFLKVAGAGLLGIGIAGLSGTRISKTPERATSKENELLESSPFDLEKQKEVLAAVSQAMGITLNPAKTPPHVLHAEGIPDADFNKMVGFETDGKRYNVFVPPDAIVLTAEGKPHNLAHEYVHYVQYTYKGITDGTTDAVEMEAIQIQNLFR